MTAMIDNTIVEIIEQLFNDNWLVLDTSTGLLIEVSEDQLTQIEY